jgi:5-methylcytosine-specific restriction enzyme B
MRNGPVKIPTNITREHVLTAMDRIGHPVGWPRQSESTEWDVVDPRSGARFPPKLVLSIAAELATGNELPRSKFSGGPQTNDPLKKLGFDVEPKAAAKAN